MSAMLDRDVGVQDREARRPRRDNLVIVPTYNESANLESIVQAIMRHKGFDILVIDDNSPDGTGAIADRLVERYPYSVVALHGPHKRGLAAAYLTGFKYAVASEYQHIFQLDADFSHDPAYLPQMRGVLEHVDVVLGSRYVSGGSTEDWPFWRRGISRVGSFYSSWVLGLPIVDLTSGYKGFNRRVLCALDLDGIHSHGYAFQIETTYRCAEKGFSVVELPIVFRNRKAGRSKMDWRIAAEAITVVWSLRSRRGARLEEAVS